MPPPASLGMAPPPVSGPQPTRTKDKKEIIPGSWDRSGIKCIPCMCKTQKYAPFLVPLRVELETFGYFWGDTQVYIWNTSELVQLTVLQAHSDSMPQNSNQLFAEFSNYNCSHVQATYIPLVVTKMSSLNSCYLGTVIPTFYED